MTTVLRPVVARTPGRVLSRLNLPGRSVTLASLSFSSFPTRIGIITGKAPVFPHHSIRRRITFVGDRVDTGRGTGNHGTVTRTTRGTGTRTRLPRVGGSVQVSIFSGISLQITRVGTTSRIRNTSGLLGFRLSSNATRNHRVLSKVTR